jgi:leucyl aminopeptidase
MAWDLIRSSLTLAADYLVVGVVDDPSDSGLSAELKPLLGPRVTTLRERRDFDAKPNELLPLHGVTGLAARAVLLVGLGKREKLTEAGLANAAGAAAKWLAGKPGRSAGFTVLDGEAAPDLGTRIVRQVTSIIAGGAGQDLFKKEKTRHPLDRLTLVSSAPESSARAGLERGLVIGEAVNLARELVNLPPIELYPQTFCERVGAAAHAAGLPFDVRDEDGIAELRMNCLLAVGAGSDRKPRLLTMRHEGGGPGKPTLALVGKGMTFDAGGVCIKPADGMLDMKCDMAGAAAVCAATIAAARLKLPVNLLTVAPLAENMLGGSAYKTGDVLRARNGKTIEIINTDAEGRLILADALSWVVDQKPARIVDLATLTGSCMVALGASVAGLMSNHEGWAEELRKVSIRTGERIWPLPMFEDYGKLIESGIADMKNLGPRWGGAITAAKLLEEFVGDIPWCHLDIAGPAWAEKESPWLDAGGTGFFVRSLVELAESFTA